MKILSFIFIFSSFVFFSSEKSPVEISLEKDTYFITQNIVFTVKYTTLTPIDIKLSDYLKLNESSKLKIQKFGLQEINIKNNELIYFQKYYIVPYLPEDIEIIFKKNDIQENIELKKSVKIIGIIPSDRLSKLKENPEWVEYEEIENFKKFIE